MSDQLAAPPLPQSALSQLVARAGRLYSLPAVTMQVLELTNNPKVDAAALKACIENDPALAVKLLRVVNSSLFGLSRQVSDLGQALALLGTKPLKLLVLGFSLPKELFAGLEARVLGRYWRHTLTKAVAAREICDLVGKIPGDEAFIAGLLQDVGLLVLVQDLGRPYVEFLEKVHREGEDLAWLELSTLGFDHITLSGRLLDHWGLPASLVRAVGLPQDDLPLARALRLAELIAQVLVEERTGALFELLETGRRQFQLSREQLAGLVDRLQEKVDQLADVLSLTLPAETSYTDVLRLAHERLADLAHDAACELSRRSSAEELVWQETKSVAEALRRFVQSGGSPASAAPPSAAANASPRATVGGEGDRPITLLPSLARPNRGPVPRRAAAELDPGLIGWVTAAVAACRRDRVPLSLLLIEVDDYAELVMARGVEGTSGLMQMLSRVIGRLCEADGDCLPIGDARFAVVLQGRERRQAVDLGRELLRGVESWSRAWDSVAGGAALTISVGAATVAMPARNFPPHDLVRAAERCLYGALASRGAGVKSIDVS